MPKGMGKAQWRKRKNVHREQRRQQAAKEALIQWSIHFHLLQMRAMKGVVRA